VTLIIVFGVSGVGKTTLCRDFAARHPEFLHLTASTLIRHSLRTTAEVLRCSSRDEILQNQLILRRALEGELKTQRASKCLLDGQCVIDNGREVIVLPSGLISPLRPSGLLLLEEKPEKIFERREADCYRRPLRTVSELSEQIKINRSTVSDYSDALRIPFRVVEAPDYGVFETALLDLISSL
jgi:adenylate kinase